MTDMYYVKVNGGEISVNANKSQKLIARIICIVLAALMVGGAAFQVIAALI